MSRTLKLDEDEREELVADIDPEFPKYTTQILNIANQNAQGTRPRVVGQMSDLVEEWAEADPEGSFEEWREFYYEECNGEERIREASERVLNMVEKMRDAAEKIDEEMVERWIKDLVLYKTYTGLGRHEEAILEKLSAVYGVEYSRSTAAEESKGIDGYLGDQPVSIKPDTYQQKSRLQEDIDAPIIYYEEYKSSNSLKLHLDELDTAMAGRTE